MIVFIKSTARYDSWTAAVSHRWRIICFFCFFWAPLHLNPSKWWMKEKKSRLLWVRKDSPQEHSFADKTVDSCMKQVIRWKLTIFTSKWYSLIVGKLNLKFNTNGWLNCNECLAIIHRSAIGAHSIFVFAFNV